MVVGYCCSPAPWFVPWPPVFPADHVNQPTRLQWGHGAYVAWRAVTYYNFKSIYYWIKGFKRNVWWVFSVERAIKWDPHGYRGTERDRRVFEPGSSQREEGSFQDRWEMKEVCEPILVMGHCRWFQQDVASQESGPCLESIHLPRPLLPKQVSHPAVKVTGRRYLSWTQEAALIPALLSTAHVSIFHSIPKSYPPWPPTSEKASDLGGWFSLLSQGGEGVRSWVQSLLREEAALQRWKKMEQELQTCLFREKMKPQSNLMCTFQFFSMHLLTLKLQWLLSERSISHSFSATCAFTASMYRYTSPLFVAVYYSIV